MVASVNVKDSVRRDLAATRWLANEGRHAIGGVGSADAPDHHRVRRHRSFRERRRRRDGSQADRRRNRLSTLVVIDPKRRGSQAVKSVRPQVKLLDTNGDEVKIPGTDHAVAIGFQVGALITVQGRSTSAGGEVLARIPTESQRRATLPVVCRVWPNCSKPVHRKTPAFLPKSLVPFRSVRTPRASSVWSITDLDGVQHEFLITKEKQVLVHDGQVVNKGEMIVDGPADPHDILRLQGVEALARYIVDEVQDVYRLQGVKINDKHIEVIVRQMLRRVQITDNGDTRFIPGEQVERSDMLDENDRMTADDKRPSTYDNVLLGITKASLSTDSFISAASFQETTRVLTEAAIMGKRDDLRGLKENVIVGRLIPAGTGLAFHKARKAREQSERERFDQIAAEEEVTFDFATPGNAG